MCEEEIFVGDFGLPHGPVYPLHTRARVKAKARVRVALPRRACRRSPAYARQWTFGTTRFFLFYWVGTERPVSYWCTGWCAMPSAPPRAMPSALRVKNTASRASGVGQWTGQRAAEA